MRALANKSTRGTIMWQMFLIPLSIVLLVSTLFPSLLDGTRANKVVSKRKGLKIYPTAISPLSRK